MTSTEAKRHADRHGAAVLRDAARKLTMKFVDDDGDHEIPERDVEKVRDQLRAAADVFERHALSPVRKPASGGRARDKLLR